MQNFFELLKLTFFSPRSVLDILIDIKLTNLKLLEALIFVTCFSTTITFCSLYLQIWIYKDNILDLDPIFVFFSKLPILLVLIQITAISIFSFLITFIGRFFSGKGDFFTVFRFVIWINFILALINVLQLLLIFISIQIAGLIGIIGTFWSLWATSALTAQAHGFKSTSLTAFVGAIITIGIFFVIIIFLQLTGFIFFEEMLDV